MCHAPDLNPIQLVLRRAGLLGDHEFARVEALPGGVSSSIFRADPPSGPPVCVKKALPRLKVLDRWEADPKRNAAERASIRIYAGVENASVPRLIYEDPVEQLFVMEYLAEARTWKDDLLNGSISVRSAEQAGRILGRVHCETSHHPELAEEFGGHDLFEQLRIDPYLRTIGRRHPDLSSRIRDAIDSLARNRFCLIHGDYSPKNIMLQGDDRMVILDHEVAVFGDPAFDLAFLVNHLFLKGIRAPDAIEALLECMQAFLKVYRRESHRAHFPDPTAGCARLLPLLMLARIDGKSPVEYLSDQQRDAARLFARDQILDSPPSIGDLMERFASRFPSCPR